MDIATIGGLILAFGMLLLAFVLEGGGNVGALADLVEPTAAMIVFGGTFGAVAICFPMENLVNIPKLLGKVFSHKKEDREKIMNTFLDLANVARKEGLLALEQQIADNEYDPFIVTGIQLVIDGADPEGLQHTLETKINTLAEHNEKGAAMFEAAGGFSPTMGVLGTVMGMVHVLSDLGSPSELGGKIAVAFIATLYGVGFANILWLPVASKLKNLAGEEVATKEMMLEGIMMLQNGSNPAFMKEQLKGYLEHAPKEESGEGQ